MLSHYHSSLVAQIREVEVSLPHFFGPTKEEGEEDGCGDDGGSGRGDKARGEGHKGSHTREETEIPGEVESQNAGNVEHLGGVMQVRTKVRSCDESCVVT